MKLESWLSLLAFVGQMSCLGFWIFEGKSLRKRIDRQDEAIRTIWSNIEMLASSDKDLMKIMVSISTQVRGEMALESEQ